LGESRGLRVAEAAIRRSLEGRKLSNNLTLQTKTNPTLLTGQLHFEVYLLGGREGVLSAAPVFSGILIRGQARLVGCVDGDYFENAAFPSGSISLNDGGLDATIFGILGELVPAGGSFTVSYSHAGRDSKVHKQTSQALGRGYPPVVTPLGYLLFQADCGIRLKNLHPRNPRESSGKLQGFKALNSGDLKKKGMQLIRELHQFMGSQAEDDELTRTCKLRAFAAIEKTQKTNF
jgi:hypothetical protein